MNNIAFFIGDISIRWHGIIMAMGVLATIISSSMLRGTQRKNMSAVLLSLIFGAALVPFLSRLVYWYCSAEQFDGLADALTTMTGGGHSMVGAVSGAFFACVLANLITGEHDLGGLLDCMMPSGLAGVCVGRLSGFFDIADKGKFEISAPAFQKLPFSVAVTDAATGETSYRVATFLFESVAALVVFVVCFVLYRGLYETKASNLHRGDVGIAALSLFAATQAVFDSMRYDALFLRSNGFICLMQMFCLMVLIACLVFASVRSCKLNGTKRQQKKRLSLWLAALLLLGQAGYMEYFVQRHGNLFVLCYIVMLIGLVGLSVITVSLLNTPAESGE